MDILTTPHSRLFSTKDGSIWSANPAFGYKSWKWYFEIFDEVKLLAPLKMLENENINNLTLVSGTGVKVMPLPYVDNIWHYLKIYNCMKKNVFLNINKASAILLRVPCPWADITWGLVNKKRPYGVMVVTDPFYAYSRGARDVAFRPILQYYTSNMMRQECLNANAALYVTKKYLQSKYPCHHYSVGVSDVEIAESYFVSSPRPISIKRGSFSLITVTQLEPYKALDVLIDAMSICVKRNLDLKLTIIGSGKYKEILQKQVNKLLLENRIIFTGHLTFHEIVPKLDEADIFLLPSRAEGLPRAMVEAMAHALPCIGSTAGGIPELISKDNIVEPGNAKMLAMKIEEIVSDPVRMSIMSSQNLIKAKEFTEAALNPARTAFLKHLKNITIQWLKKS